MIITLSDVSYKECENLFRLPAALVFLTSCQKVVKKKSANDLINMMYVCMFTWRYLFIHFKNLRNHILFYVALKSTAPYKMGAMDINDFLSNDLKLFFLICNISSFIGILILLLHSDKRLSNVIEFRLVKELMVVTMEK